jgi:hypothetical protein
MSVPKIFVYCIAAWGADDVAGSALAEDGTFLAGHISMGVTSERKRDVYAVKYPDGYELVWLSKSDMETNSEFASALILNQAIEDAGTRNAKGAE